MKGFSTTLTTCKKLWSPVNVAMSMMLMAILFSANVNAQQRTVPTRNVTVWTNQPSYPSGATVYITGRGWQPGETVVLRVSHQPSVEADLSNPAFQSWTVVADSRGDITSSWTTTNEDHVTLLLTAQGNTSESTARTTFTENFTVDFSQGANKDNPFPLGTLHWIGSILQSSNSRIVEGMSTLQ